ncbi:EAL domain-containing protein [Xanthomonas albilineans]|uniref:Putative diguanylate phosphodiesterase protein n=1 Tax=Xanthomonas albilineans (strain GPE PC73 / CFBP 7063) TaxID=380358 RepID=D2U9N8_XANAP|nr:EAL domain-containing protein [Xanthomonas albilineans]PPU93551.1 EAL domain-containing protein [Xanthomonas albilineans]QHQ29227.1 putative diguanylate phosphodiesterase protein [Xanthomonas albilineans]CBA16990.1 putative diguanylate phosphodiesterase protein [Xanthomonas albilineans GPE PC73]
MILRSQSAELGQPAYGNCGDAEPLDFAVHMAFQPIVDAATRTIYAYEALVRGEDGSSAAAMLGRVRPEQLHHFDQTCRVQAIATATRLGLRTRLSINFIPNAMYEPTTCIRMTLAAAERFGMPISGLIFELSESEYITDLPKVMQILNRCAEHGFLTAIDDFGAGHSGLNLLADFQPHLIKLDIGLIHGIDTSATRRHIVGGIVQMAAALGCTVLAEGVETPAEYHALRTLGIDLYQGYLFAKPALEALPRIPTALWKRLEGTG